MMIKLLNQYSFIVVALALAPLVTYFVWHTYNIKWAITATILFLLILMGVLYFVKSTPLEVDVSDFKSSITSGEPTLIIIQSDFCIACLSAKPAIDKLEKNLTGHLTVLRVNTRSNLAKYLRETYSWDFVPTFILFNRHGNEVWRQTGRVPSIDTLLSIR